MKKSVRALVGIVVMDLLLLAGGGWMVWQTKTGAWQARDEAATISAITSATGGAIGIVTVILAIAFVIHRRNGN